MHQAMLDGDIQQQSRRGIPSPPRRQRARQSFIDGLPNLTNILADLLEGWPIRGLVGWQAAIHGINSERK